MIIHRRRIQNIHKENALWFNIITYKGSFTVKNTASNSKIVLHLILLCNFPLSVIYIYIYIVRELTSNIFICMGAYPVLMFALVTFYSDMLLSNLQCYSIPVLKAIIFLLEYKRHILQKCSEWCVSMLSEEKPMLLKDRHQLLKRPPKQIVGFSTI